MTLKKRENPYIIPEYSLTGDILSYLTCELQYRYQSKGALPPSKPVQLWFGEFIHGVMEEAYIEWKFNDKKKFPWDWKSEIHKIEMDINNQLEARGLSTSGKTFCGYDENTSTKHECKDNKHPHKYIASKRADLSINTWGPHLFPLIEKAEIKLKGNRNMIEYDPNSCRSKYYGINGIIDVLSSVNFIEAKPGNLIINYLYQNEQIKELINSISSENFEIIIDYKGMNRPAIDDEMWEHHERQILTYANLRYQQQKSIGELKPIVAGIIFYLNELDLSEKDTKILIKNIKNKNTDIMPEEKDSNAIKKWKKGKVSLSSYYREKRSIRLIPITQDKINESLDNFDDVVRNIERSVINEMNGTPITEAWHPKYSEKTCTACSHKTYCPATKEKEEGQPSVP